MRRFYMLRGIPASGKSTFIKKNNLSKYTISTDNIRKLFVVPNVEWNFENESLFDEIDQTHNKQVFETIDKMLETRFSSESTTILDATNINVKSLNKYYKMAKSYNYRVYIVDFMKGLSLEEIKKRNLKRKEMVPTEVLDRMYHNYLDTKLSNRFDVISPDEMLKTFEWHKFDANKYNKIRVIGDIHNSATPLKELIKDFDENVLYVFVGDYFDRGIEPAETMKVLNNLLNKENVIFLEGNHEIHIRNYVVGNQKGVGYEFKEHTLPELYKSNINVDSFLRKLLNKLRDVVILDFHGKTIILTHGGLTDQQLDFNKYGLHNSHYFVKGIGKYELDIDKLFDKNITDKNLYQVHGHRNTFLHGVKDFKHSFNLEQKVECGNKLGALDIIPKENNLQFVDISVNNTAINKSNGWDEFSEVINQHEYQHSKYLIHKSIADAKNVTMYHFSREAFNKGAWDENTMSARGLYIDDTNHVVARGFNKFFVMDEREGTMRKDVIKKMIEADKVIVSDKLDGFLCIVSYLANEDKLLITSKGNGKDYSDLAKEVLIKTLNYSVDKFTLDDLKEFMKKDYLNGKRYSLTFEILDEEKDPHLVEYRKKEAVLLEVIPNTLNKNSLISKNMPINECENKMKEIINKFYFTFTHPKEKVYTNLDEKMANKIINTIYNSTKPFEGVVITTIKDNEEYKFKLKTLYFRRMKWFRTAFTKIINIMMKNKTNNDNIIFLENALLKLNNINKLKKSKTLNENEINNLINILKEIINKLIIELQNNVSVNELVIWSSMEKPLKKINMMKTLKKYNLLSKFE